MRQHSNVNPYPPGTFWHDLEELRLAWHVVLRSLRAALRFRLLP